MERRDTMMVAASGQAMDENSLDVWTGDLGGVEKQEQGSRDKGALNGEFKGTLTQKKETGGTTSVVRQQSGDPSA